MPLQTDRLVMIGLCTKDDLTRRPLDIQPPLPDGNHLRWFFRRDAAFPWFGYYLFRRVHEKSPSKWLSVRHYLNENYLNSPTRTWSLANFGTFRSDSNLSLTSYTGQPGKWGLGLTGRSYLEFEPAVENLPFRMDVTVGFRPVQENCIDVPIEPQKQFNPLQYTLENVGLDYKIQTSGGHGQLHAEKIITVTLPVLAHQVFLDFTSDYGVKITLEILDDQGNVIQETGTKQAPQFKPQTFELSGPNPFLVFRIRSTILYQELEAPYQALLHRICYRYENPGRSIIVTGFDGEMLVTSSFLEYSVGQTRTVSLLFDRLTSLHVSSGDGVLLDLQYFPISDAATQGWQTLTDFPYPLTLPITHHDYPASQGNTNISVDWETAKTRIQYGPSEDWEGEPFKELHDELWRLVVGGVPGLPERSMDHPIRARVNVPNDEQQATLEDTPIIAELHPLDLVVLGSVHPAFAQMLGLYWIDTTAESSSSYDYLLIADHSGVAQNDPETLLAYIRSNGFDNLDAWITYNIGHAPAPPLARPQDVRAYALPGGTYRGADGTIHDATGNVGLTWSRSRNDEGYLRPNHPVMYHVWRCYQDNKINPVAANIEELITEDSPLLLVSPPGFEEQSENPHRREDPDNVNSDWLLFDNPLNIQADPVQHPADWPPFSMQYIDFGREEGWYGYKVNSIDLFGRYSAKSSFAAWWQWAPPPTPVPWYYSNPPTPRIVHPSSIRILDKLAPPPPHAVEATILDPTDPFLVRDQAYEKWLADLSPEERPTLVGLRVRWWWTAAQQQQAPDTEDGNTTTEFRLYWNSGSQLPGLVPDDPQTADHWRDVNRWEQRCFVCAYHQHVTVLDKDELVKLENGGQAMWTVIHHKGDRRYEIFLPSVDAAEPFRNHIPLEPTLADPIAYANITVTAVDNAQHSPDRWPGAGLLANRTGNESQPAAPQRIYRVWRQQPAPPPSLPKPDRAYATPADYHNRSYYTYEWKKTDSSLWVHVCRALDDSIFKIDWAIRSQRGPIALPEHRQYFPPDWSEYRCANTATALNNLSTLEGYRELSDDDLRALASLPGNEKAFTQITTAPLDSSVTSLRDTLDGRGTGRYFYRTAYVDKAQNRSSLSIASPPVYLPDVTPPKAPVITKVVGGDRAITIEWASNREPDLAEYRIYRAENREFAGDIRLMTLVHTESVAQEDPSLRAASVNWTDKPLPGLKDFWYGMVAVDRIDPVDSQRGGGNISSLSTVFRARAQQPFPNAPEVAVPAWDAARLTISVNWQTDDPFLESRLERRTGEGDPWRVVGDWLPADLTSAQDSPPAPGLAYEYRVRVRNHIGQQAVSDPVATP